MIAIDSLNNIKKRKQIGKGQGGKCYLIGTDKVYKKLYYAINEGSSKYEQYQILESLNYMKHIIFPQDLIVIETAGRKKIIGYTMPYLKTKGIYTIGINGLLSDIGELETEIEELSSVYEILINDLFEGNIIIGDSIYLIDTDEYYRTPYHTVEQIRKFNFVEMNKHILEKLLDSKLFLRTYNFINNGKIGFSEELIKEFIWGVVPLSQYLKLLINNLEEDNDKQIDNIKDLRVCLRRTLYKSSF